MPPPWHAATLEDGIRFYEGRPQLYGTMWDWDAEGRLRPWTIQDPDGVDERRAAVGLPSLEEQAREVSAADEFPPADPEARLREAADWARSVGWRVSTVTTMNNGVRPLLHHSCCASHGGVPAGAHGYGRGSDRRC